MENNQPSLLKRLTPLLIFVALVALLAVGLTLNPRLVPSPLIGKPAPVFELPLLYKEGSFSNKDLIGHVTLVNVWASWCFACRQEHETVKQLGRNGVRIIGHDNLPGHVALHASQMYSSNLMNFIQHFWDEETKSLEINTEDEIMVGALVTDDCAITSEMLQKAYASA